MMKKFLAMLSLCVLLATQASAIERDAEMDALLEAQMGVSVDNVLAALDGYSPKIEEVDRYMAEIARMRDVLHYLMCLVYDQTGYPMPAPTLEGLSYDQLVSYRDALNLAIWNSQEWQEVTVPQGLYKIGEDIPAGHWTFAIADIGGVPYLQYGNKLEGNKKEVSFMGDIYYAEQLRGPDSSYYDPKHDLLTLDLHLEEGCWLEVSNSPVKVTPYAGKPDLGFK